MPLFRRASVSLQHLYDFDAVFATTLPASCTSIGPRPGEDLYVFALLGHYLAINYSVPRSILLLNIFVDVSAQQALPPITHRKKLELDVPSCDIEVTLFAQCNQGFSSFKPLAAGLRGTRGECAPPAKAALASATMYTLRAIWGGYTDTQRLPIETESNVVERAARKQQETSVADRTTQIYPVAKNAARLARRSTSCGAIDPAPCGASFLRATTNTKKKKPGLAAAKDNKT